MPFDEIQEFINQIRSSDYEMLTSMKKRPHSPALQHLNIPNREIVTLKVNRDNRQIVGKSIEDSGIGKNFQVTLLAIQRDRRYLTEISPKTIIEQGDLLYLFGHPTNINHLNDQLSFK